MELIIVHIMTDSTRCTPAEEECQQSEKRVSYQLDSSNLSGLNKPTGWEMKLCSTWMCVLQKVPFGGFSECERTYYGLMGTQRHFTVISTSSQQTNTHQRASSPRSDKEMQPNSASIGPMNNSEEQITLCDWSGPSGITKSLAYLMKMMTLLTHLGISKYLKLRWVF